MADIAWPSGLKTCITETKRRDEVIGYIEDPVSSGPSFVELISDDNPTTFDVTFVFNRGQAMAFQAWLRLNNVKTESPFFDTFPLQIEEGLFDQEVRFTSSGYPQCITQSGDVFTYRAIVLCRQINNPYDDLDLNDIILALGEENDYRVQWAMELLDITVNISMPDA